MMGFDRISEDGNDIVPACGKCPTDEECSREWLIWSSDRGSGGWRVGDDMSRKADILSLTVLESLPRSTRDIIEGWDGARNSDTKAVLERAATFIQEVMPPTKEVAITAALLLSDCWGGPERDPVAEIKEWKLEQLLVDGDDDAFYPLGRMRDIMSGGLTQAKKATEARKIMYHDTLPTGMASERGQWARVRACNRLEAPARRMAMGWGDYEMALAHAAEASGLSEIQLSGLELQAVHGAPAAAIARLTEHILGYHPVGEEWEGIEGSFALLGAGAGFLGLPWVEVIESHGQAPQEVLYAECMESAAAYHDAIFTSLGMLPVRFKWAHGPALHGCGLRARRVLASMCCDVGLPRLHSS